MGTPDKAKAAEQWDRWYAAHREEALIKKRASYHANRERHLAEQRAYREEHREEIRAQSRIHGREAWRAKSQSERFAFGADQRARRFGDMTRLDFANLSDGPCVYCGRADESVTWDHVIPLSRGGRNEASNCVRCCRSCNTKKQTRTAQEWKDPAYYEAKRERKRAYVRQWHRDHYAEVYEKRRARRAEIGHW